MLGNGQNLKTNCSHVCAQLTLHTSILAEVQGTRGFGRSVHRVESASTAQSFYEKLLRKRRPQERLKRGRLEA